MRIFWNVLLALVIPIGWGVLSSWFFDYLRTRRGKKQDCNEGNNV